MKQILLAASDSSRYKIAIVTALAVLSVNCARAPEGVQTPAPSSNLTANSDIGRINLNTATTAELQRLPGIGEVLAERIIEHRTRYGPFRRAEHLMMVRGISERKFLELQPLIVAK